MTNRAEFANEAINALGGTSAVAVMFRVDQRVVSNWRLRGLPPDTYAVIAPLLAARGRDVSPEDFGQRVIGALAPPRARRSKRVNGKPRAKAKRSKR